MGSITHPRLELLHRIWEERRLWESRNIIWSLKRTNWSDSHKPLSLLSWVIQERLSNEKPSCRPHPQFPKATKEVICTTGEGTDWRRPQEVSNPAFLDLAHFLPVCLNSVLSMHAHTITTHTPPPNKQTNKNHNPQTIFGTQTGSSKPMYRFFPLKNEKEQKSWITGGYGFFSSLESYNELTSNQSTPR